MPVSEWASRHDQEEVRNREKHGEKGKTREEENKKEDRESTMSGRLIILRVLTVHSLIVSLILHHVVLYYMLLKFLFLTFILHGSLSTGHLSSLVIEPVPRLISNLNAATAPYHTAL